MENISFVGLISLRGQVPPGCLLSSLTVFRPRPRQWWCLRLSSCTVEARLYVESMATHGIFERVQTGFLGTTKSFAGTMSSCTCTSLQWGTHPFPLHSAGRDQFSIPLSN